LSAGATGRSDLADRCLFAAGGGVGGEASKQRSFYQRPDGERQTHRHQMLDGEGARPPILTAHELPPPVCYREFVIGMPNVGAEAQ
jgi:hypothetical protein